MSSSEVHGSLALDAHRAGMDGHGASPRKRTLLRGRIEYSNKQFSLDCLIRDLSETGARLSVSENVSLPAKFDIPDRREPVPVELCWRIRDGAGVRILSGSENQHPVAALTVAEARVRELEAEVAKLRHLLEQIREDPIKVSYLLDRAV